MVWANGMPVLAETYDVVVGAGGDGPWSRGGDSWILNADWFRAIGGEPGNSTKGGAGGRFVIMPAIMPKTAGGGVGG